MANEKNRIGDNLEDIRRLLDIETPQREDASEIEYAWYVGATGNGQRDDYSEQYIDENRWENGWDDQFVDEVKSMKPGDRIAIKSRSKMKYGLPFNNNGKWVGFADIKAIGTITSNPGDGKNISVQWKRINPAKRWYSHIGFIWDTVNLVKASDGFYKKALLDFTFGDRIQDYSLCEEKYSSVEELDTVTTVDNNIFDGFQPWLTTYHNPDYSGKEKYIGYAQNLRKLIDFMYKEGIISSNELNELSVERYQTYLSAYEASEKAIDYDNTKLSSKAGSAALKKYILYIDYLLHPSFEYCDCVSGGENLVVYGTPGCGKSFYVDHEILGKDDAGKYIGDYSERTVIRTTFYQDYSNTDFVGQIVPVIEYEKDSDGVDKSVVTYHFVPGPFTMALECALENPTKKVALVIEELNRGNAPCIFGDLFQLLDRIDEEGKDYPVGTSEYGIINTNLLNYLKDNDPAHYKKEYKYCFNLNEIRIPANLSIYATMNTSDQNVFTLDTAFKRRWDFFKLQNKFENHSYKDYKVPGMLNMTWERFVDAINKHIANLSNESGVLTTEDKQIGVYFAAKKLLIEPGQEEKDTLKKKFAYKVLEYLWDDVAKYSRDRWFVKTTTLDDLIEDYCSGKQVFKDGIFTNSDSSEA